MDDFRVGSVPPSAPYGERHQYDAAVRRRQRQHHDDEHGEPRDGDTADTFEVSSDDQEPPAAGEEIADYYLPSAAPEDDV